MSSRDLSGAASAQRLAAIVEGSSDAIITQALDGTITSWNPAAERAFGFTTEEALGQSIRIIVPNARQREQDDAVTRVSRGEPVSPFDTVRQGKDGTRVRISLAVSPVRDKRHRVVGASQIARGISRRRETTATAPAAPADLGDRLRTVVSASGSLLMSPGVENVLSAMLDLAGALIPADGYAVWRVQAGRWKMEACRGVSDEFQQRTLSPLPRQAAPAPPYTEVVLADDLGTAPRREDGLETYRQERIVSLLAIPLFVGGETTGAFAFYHRDRHTGTELERQTAAAFGNMASAALTTAALYDDQSRRHEQSSFLAEASAVLGTSLDYRGTLTRIASLAVPHIADWCAVDLVGDSGALERLAVAHVDPAKLGLVRRFEAGSAGNADSPYSAHTAIRTGKSALVSFISDEMNVRAANGDQDRIDLVRELGLTSYMCVPLLGHQRRPIGALTFVSAESGRRFWHADLVFAEDLAGRTALAVDNARAYDEARRANQLKDEFLATLSHELRTPLNAIVGYARMLEAGVLGPDKRQTALKIVSRNSTALTQIVEDVLDVSRIVSGKVRLDVQPVDLSTLLAEAVATTRLAADAKGIVVMAAIDPRAGFVAGDPDRLRQILWNLLSNAVKFTRTDGRIHVRLDRVDSNVEVVVTDTGVGLSPAFLPHVFERFRQADSRFSREHGGLGLGLAISRHLVEMHGGTISAESEGEGKGATFRVRIPVMLGARPADADRAGVPRAADNRSDRATMERLDGLRVVAVDDEEDALTLLRDILQAAGASVTTVRSPTAAAAVVEGTRPDVLITDIGMTGMDGFQLLDQVRHSRAPEVSRVPAVALTAYARSEDRLMALRAGFQMHLAKPIDPDELVAAVRTLARRASV